MAQLHHRRTIAVPHCFYLPRVFKPMRHRDVYALVKNVKNRVFPRSNDANARVVIYPHAFRHYFITDARAREVPDAAIQRAVGHSSLAMLDRYTNVSDEWVRNAFLQARGRRRKRPPRKPPEPLQG
jgi:integrase